MKRLSFVILLTIAYISLSAQMQRPKPIFETFKGTVYDMKTSKIKISETSKTFRISIKEYYDENIYGYDSIGTVELDQINIPEILIGDGFFPGVNQTVRFCMGFCILK